MRPDPIVILLVEDNVDHALLTRKALHNNGLANEIRVAGDGQEALDYLFHQGPYADPASAPRPGLILLDLQLPKVSGTEVLEKIKAAPDLHTIPVVILTTSDREGDIATSYINGANSYVTKPVSFADFADKVRSIKLYWLLTNTLLEK